MLIDLKNVTKIYQLGNRSLCAVDHVSLRLEKNEIFGLVGESGCGKSTLGRMLLRFTSPTSGKIFFKGEEITNRINKTLAAQMQMIFQNPFSSLNPRMTIEDIVNEPLKIHHRPYRVNELFELVGLSPILKNRLPHELSGGQKQRVGIARAIALQPDFIVCDEPTSSLDVPTQAQILDLLLRLAKDHQLTYLFITHNLAILQKIATRVGVMYAGGLVELGFQKETYKAPLHPYTQLLFASIPQVHEQQFQPIPLKPTSVPSFGCPFAPKCPYKRQECSQSKPALKEITPGHFVACHLLNKEVYTERDSKIGFGLAPKPLYSTITNCPNISNNLNFGFQNLSRN